MYQYGLVRQSPQFLFIYACTFDFDIFQKIFMTGYHIVRFTTADEGMGDCVGAGLGAPTGGSVMWTGSGMFAAR